MRRWFGRSPTGLPGPGDEPAGEPVVDAPIVAVVENGDEAAPALAAPVTFGPPARRRLAAEAMAAEAVPLDSPEDVPGAIVNALEGFLEAVEGVPDPSVVIAHLTPRTIGLGGLRGLEHRSPFAQVELRGGRVEGVVRFQVWGSDASAANEEMLALQGRLLAASTDLAGSGFLEMGGVAGTLAASDDDAWGRTCDYRFLYEYLLAPTAQAEGLIARIRVTDLGEHTDELVRWDRELAPALVLRGRRTLDRLAVAASVPGQPPAGGVSLLRTSDGAQGPPTDHADLSSFLTAVGGSGPQETHARFTFDTVADFLAAFADTGDPLLLGDWDGDGLPDTYHAGELSLVPSIPLPRARDRVEIALASSPFEQESNAVVYLRAAGTLG